MAKLIRHESIGKRLLLFVLFLTGIGVPLAPIYLIEATVAIEGEVEDPAKFLEKRDRSNFHGSKNAKNGTGPISTARKTGPVQFPGTHDS